MIPDILVAGSTGLIGSTFIKKALKKYSYNKIIALTRKEIPSLADNSNIHQLLIDFQNINKIKSQIRAKSVICALGTTIKKAGSQQKFREIDYQYTLDIARYAAQNQCSKCILISAVGANPDSRFFYNRVKGELERDLQTLSFREIHILRPSLLLGNRKEFRLGEKIGSLILPKIDFLIPELYKPIHAEKISEKIISILQNSKQGTHIYEGKKLLLNEHS